MPRARPQRRGAGRGAPDSSDSDDSSASDEDARLLPERYAAANIRHGLESRWARRRRTMRAVRRADPTSCAATALAATKRTASPHAPKPRPNTSARNLRVRALQELRLIAEAEYRHADKRLQAAIFEDLLAAARASDRCASGCGGARSSLSVAWGVYQLGACVATKAGRPRVGCRLRGEQPPPSHVFTSLSLFSARPAAGRRRARRRRR